LVYSTNGAFSISALKDDTDIVNRLFDSMNFGLAIISLFQ
jgi:hypothetical protein